MNTRSNSQTSNWTLDITKDQLKSLIDKATSEAVEKALIQNSTPPPYSDKQLNSTRILNIMPTFDGSNMDIGEWTFLIENIIDNTEINETNAWNAARLQLRGHALTW